MVAVASHPGKLPRQVGYNGGSLSFRAGKRPGTSALSTKIAKQEDALPPHFADSYSRMDFVYHTLRSGLYGCQSEM